MRMRTLGNLLLVGLSPLAGWLHPFDAPLSHLFERPAMSESDISAELLDTPVSAQDVATITKYLTKWEDLSPFLDLTQQDQTNICNTYRDYNYQKRQALRKWREIKGDAATYRALITAAEEIPNLELVDKVKAMLWTREKPTGKTT